MTGFSSAWQRLPVFIVGGGPSAAGFSVEALRGRGLVVGVNDAALKLPGCDVAFSADGSWINHRRRELAAFEGEVVVAQPAGLRVPVSGAVVLERLAGAGLPPRPGAIHFAANSGYGALMAAVAAGATEIVLVGFDLQGSGHWHGGYEWQCRFGVEHYPEWAAAFDAAAPLLAERGVTVWNTSMGSRITGFPRMRLEAVLDELAVRYWASGRGLGNLTPRRQLWPEGEAFFRMLATIAHRWRNDNVTVAEFGCGAGRLAPFFQRDRYLGLDICPGAIAAAREANPDYRFQLIGPGDRVWGYGSVVAHTVLLHVPDGMLPATIGRLQTERVLVSEIMGRSWRTAGEPPVYNRDQAEYQEAFREAGYSLISTVKSPYARYGGVDLTLLEFVRG